MSCDCARRVIVAVLVFFIPLRCETPDTREGAAARVPPHPVRHGSTDVTIGLDDLLVVKDLLGAHTRRRRPLARQDHPHRPLRTTRTRSASPYLDIDSGVASPDKIIGKAFENPTSATTRLRGTRPIPVLHRTAARTGRTSCRWSPGLSNLISADTVFGSSRSSRSSHSSDSLGSKLAAQQRLGRHRAHRARSSHPHHPAAPQLHSSTAPQLHSSNSTAHGSRVTAGLHTPCASHTCSHSEHAVHALPRA